MEYINIGHVQYLVAALVVVAALYATTKNRPIFAKLAAMLGLTFIIVLQLMKAPEVKETALDSRIRLERQLLASYSDRPGVPAEFSGIIDELGQINFSDARRSDPAVAAPLLDKLAALEFPAPFMKEQADSLVASWRARLESSPAALRAELAALEAKAEKSPEDLQRLAMIRGMIPAWYDRLPLKFGLDLRGGTEVRLRLLPERARLDNFNRQLAALQENPEGKESEIAELEERIKEETEKLDDNFRNASDVIRTRLNSSGLEEISVSTQGGDKLLIQMPGMSSAEAQGVINRVRRLGQLEFRLAVPSDGDGAQIVSAVSAVGGAEDRRNFSVREGRFLGDDEIIIRDDMKTDVHGDPLYDWMHDDSGRGMVLSQEVLMTGEYLSSARARPSQQNPGSFEIMFWLTPHGSLIFGNITGNNIGRNLAIVLDGKLKSAPTIQSTITTNGTITGNFTSREASDLEVVLKSGSLKTRVEVDFENTVGPTLGEDSIRASVQAMLIGFAIVLLFMLFYYRIAGMVTDVVLFINMLLIVALLSASNATLTLPGIAGLVLTIGMAVDANVLIFERIREERAKGNALSRAIQLGYERAFVTIVDANVTTFLTALILHQFGTEAVKGFAMTLIIGIICSVFTSLVLTRWCFEAMLGFGWLRELSMARFFKEPSFRFCRVRRVVMFFSLIAIVIGMVVVVGRGKRNLAQDFTGGLFAQVALTEDINMEQAREMIKPLYADFSDLTIQSYGQDRGGRFNEFILRTANIKSPNEEENVNTRATKNAEELRAMLAEIFPLQRDGLRVGTQRLADKSTPEKAVFAVEISMSAPRRPAEVVEMLARNTILENVTAVTDGDDAVADVKVEVALPVLGTDGLQRDDVDMATIIRDQLQKLRTQGLLNFTEPFPRFSNIGASVANEMIGSAIMALVFSMIAIFIYIWLRFQFRLSFGAGAVVALAHDVLFTLGALAVADELGLLNGQISLTVVAALLTLVGYSLNDTIVIFDRIRENMHLTSKSLEDQIDLSINQTLSRTIITSLTTIMVVLALLWAGGEVIRGFSFALFVGIVVGTYSSIFIAAPILVEFTLWAKRRKERQDEERLLAGQRK